MKKIIILCSAWLLLTAAEANAETIYTTGVDEYRTAISERVPSLTLSGLSLNSESGTDPILFVPEEVPDSGCGAQYDICDEYGVHTLIYGSSEEADAAYEYFEENGIAVCRNGELTLAGDKVSKTTYAPYLSWGPAYIGTDKANAALLSIYGSVSNMPEVTIVEIDSGIDYNHPFLSGRIDYESGYDYYNDDDDPMDDNRHGTHVAGIIADNTLENVKIIPIKVASAEGKFSVLQLKCGLQKAAELQPDIINMSIAASVEDFSMSYKSAFAPYFNELIQEGTIICCAAGNATLDSETNSYVVRNADYIFPAYMDHVITVSNCNKYGTLSSTSNYGTVIDFAAPGTTIYSTILNSEYLDISGTSMACPFAASAVAMLRTYDKSITFSEAETILVSNVKSFSVAPSQSYGAGILNVSSIIPTPEPTEEPTSEPTPEPTETPTEEPTPDIYTLKLSFTRVHDSVYVLSNNYQIPDDHTLYIAQYDGDGMLVSLTTANCGTIVMPVSSAAVLKAFAFSNINQQPLCRAVSCVIE